MNNIEPTLQENKDRFVLFPIKHHDIWKLYKQIENGFWYIDNVSFDKDIDDYNNNLTKDEKLFFRFAISNMQLRFNNNIHTIITKFMDEIQYPEARCFLGFQTMMSAIHSETYSILAGTFLGNIESDNPLFKQLVNSEALKVKSAWMEKRFVNEPNFSKRLIAYIAIQRVSSTSLFFAILSFKGRELMHVLTMIMDFIFADEGLFTDFSISVYSQLVNKLSTEEVNEILKETVEMELQFIEEFSQFFELAKVDVNAINTYVRHIADAIALSLKINPIYNVHENPFKHILWKRTYRIIDPNERRPDKSQENRFSLEEEF